MRPAQGATKAAVLAALKDVSAIATVQAAAVDPQVAEPLAVEPQTAGPAHNAGRPAPGATKHAVLAALAGGGAMTAGGFPNR